MKQKNIKLFLLLSLLLPGRMTIAKVSQDDMDIAALNEQCNYSLVYIDEGARKSILALNNLLSKHSYTCADWTNTAIKIAQNPAK